MTVYGFCSRCSRHSEGPRTPRGYLGSVVTVAVPYVASGRLFGPTGRYSPQSTQPVIRLCETCLDEIWPEWREAARTEDIMDELSPGWHRTAEVV